MELRKVKKLTGGSKPDGSYRLSDHWNFESKGDVHCRLQGTDKYTQRLILARYDAKTKDYKILEVFDND